jgi:Aspartyl protease
MIRGYFHARGLRRRPFVNAILSIPSFAQKTLDIRLLIDTGADRTVLAPNDAERLAQQFGIDLAKLPNGMPSTGVGGRTETRTIEVVLSLDTFVTTPFALTILEPPRGISLPIPSLLGRDILSSFALFLEERTDRVLLLEPGEADAITFPYQEGWA